MEIKEKFNSDLSKKIFSNSKNKLLYLKELEVKLGEDFNLKKSTKPKILDEFIVRNWKYEISKNIIRKLFKESEKYKRGKEADTVMKILVKEWKKKNLGEVSWPFSQGDFDNFVQRINSLNEIGEIKDEKVKLAAVKFRRLKEINTLRNDFLEILIFEKNQNIIPTLNHIRGTDFFIDGKSFDQKVSRSVTKQFQKDFGENWKEKAIKNPAQVAEYLYKYQDEGRFGADERLLIVYLQENIKVEKIREIIENTNLEKPLEINFEYLHNKGKSTEKTKTYKVQCFCVLLW
jgi:hypothetical protein